MGMRELDSDELNRLLEAWDRLVYQTSRKRTALTSGLIPVREYVAASAIEAWRRWPEILDQLDQTVGAAELGAAMRGPGTQTTNAHPFALVTIPLSGWRLNSALAEHGIVDEVPDTENRLRTIFDFWRRFVEPWRADGFRTCWDAADTLRSCDPDTITELAAHARPVTSDAENTKVRRFVAGMQQYLFLMYLDTRLGTGDSGPYPLPDGRHMIVREFSNLGSSWIPWSDPSEAPTADIAHNNMVIGLIFEPGIHNRVNDLASTFSVPADNLAHLEAVSVCAVERDGPLVPLDFDAQQELSAAIRKSQTAVYRKVAGWSTEEKVHAGALVYFRGLLWPFTSRAGIDSDIDWTLPLGPTEAAWPIFVGGLPVEGEMSQPLFPRLP